MKLKIDENLSISIAELLREHGHDENLQGCSDIQISATVRDEKRAILTLDSDFANRLKFEHNTLPGVIFLRPGRQDILSVKELVLKILPFLESEDISGKLWIVSEKNIRIR